MHAGADGFDIAGRDVRGAIPGGQRLGAAPRAPVPSTAWIRFACRIVRMPERDRQTPRFLAMQQAADAVLPARRSPGPGSRAAARRASRNVTCYPVPGQVGQAVAAGPGKRRSGVARSPARTSRPRIAAARCGPARPRPAPVAPPRAGTHGWRSTAAARRTAATRKSVTALSSSKSRIFRGHHVRVQRGDVLLGQFRAPWLGLGGARGRRRTAGPETSR